MATYILGAVLLAALFLAVRGMVRHFGGGKAELFLTDEKDVLHAGVEIEVQLPS